MGVKLERHPKQEWWHQRWIYIWLSMSFTHTGRIYGNPKTKPGSGPVELSIYTIPRAVPLYVHRLVVGY